MILGFLLVQRSEEESYTFSIGGLSWSRPLCGGCSPVLSSTEHHFLMRGVKAGEEIGLWADIFANYYRLGYALHCWAW